MKNAIVMAHGIDPPLVSGSFPNNPGPVESMPCAMYSKKCTGQQWDKPGDDDVRGLREFAEFCFLLWIPRVGRVRLQFSDWPVNYLDVEPDARVVKNRFGHLCNTK